MEAHPLLGGAPPGKEHYVYTASLRDAPGQGALFTKPSCLEERSE